MQKQLRCLRYQVPYEVCYEEVRDTTSHAHEEERGATE